MLSVALVLLAALSASAAPSLHLDIAGPSSVSDVKDLTLKATLTNTGDEALKLFNDPRTTLSTRETNTFGIVKGNTSPRFTGAKVKYSFDAALKSGDDTLFTFLQPGQSVSVDHSLAGVYNFTNSGAGTYTIDANPRFHYVSSDAATPIEATVSSHTSTVSGVLSHARPSSGLRKRSSFNGCSSSRESALNTAAPQAITYAKNAYTYLTGISAATTRYTTWFGTYSASRKSAVQSHYQSISTEALTTSFTFDCTCTDADTYAYVYPDTYGTIYLCGAFWSAPATGTDSKAGTLVHESSHFPQNGGTEDYAYGQTDAKALAKSNPAEAIENADSHEYFAENNPSQS